MIGSVILADRGCRCRVTKETRRFPQQIGSAR